MTNFKRRKISLKMEKEHRVIKQQLNQIKGGATSTEYIIVF